MAISQGVKNTMTDLGLLILRLGAAFLLIGGHGWDKFANFNANLDKMVDPLGFGKQPSLILAIFAEVVCAGLVGIGLLTRVTAITVAIFFVVAAFVVHQEHPLFVAQGMPAKEFALLYLVMFLTLVFTGPGRYSADGLIFRRRA